MEVGCCRIWKVENYGLGGHLEFGSGGTEHEQGSRSSKQQLSFSRHNKEILCPKPFRPISTATTSPACFITDDAFDTTYDNRSYSSCRDTRNWSGRNVESTPDKFNLFLHKDKFEFDGFDECCPPLRTDNPLVRDTLFINQCETDDRPHNHAEVSYKHDSTRLQTILRIEGFACGS